MTQDKKDEIVEACSEFIDEALFVSKHGNHIEMTMPFPYDDGDCACICITPRPDGMWIVGDAGETAFHQALTIDDVKEICQRYRLWYDDDGLDYTPPFKCEIFDIVKPCDFRKAIQGIIMAIRDSGYYVARRSSRIRKGD